jgi:branched-subunit amino acid transport protein
VETRAALVLIGGMALATYATRVPLVMLVTRQLRLPRLLVHIFECIPTAAFAAIIVPGVVSPNHGPVDLSPGNLYLYAAVAAIVATRYTHNLLVALVVGVGVVLVLSLVT